MDSTLANLTSNSTDYDLWHQEFALRAPDGTFFVANTDDINQLQALATTGSTIFGTQLGASLILFVVLLTVTSSEKRLSLAFIFNTLALICNVIRCALQCSQYNGLLTNFLVLELQDYEIPGIGHAIASAVTGSLFTLFLFILIELALILQVNIIYAAASALRRGIITGISVAIALLAIGFRINLTVVNIRNILSIATISLDIVETIRWASSAANISAVISIAIFSAIFCYKLAESIRSRRRMGIKQFGPMQIIFIMGCQTLLLPLIFAIIAYFALPGAQLQSFVETLVAIFLPLSSMWASANTNAKLKSAHVAAILALPSYRDEKRSQSSSVSETLLESGSVSSPVKSRFHAKQQGLEMHRIESGSQLGSRKTSQVSVVHAL